MLSRETSIFPPPKRAILAPKRQNVPSWSANDRTNSEGSTVSSENAGKGRLDAEALESILEVTRRLAAPFDLAEMLERIIEAGRAVLAADRGTVFLPVSYTHLTLPTILRV